MDSAQQITKNKINKDHLVNPANLRILMFAPGFAPFSFSENIVNSKLALAFQRQGWKIDVISRVDAGPLYSTDWRAPWLPLRDSTHVVEYSHGNRLTRLIDLFYQALRMRYPIGGLRWAGRALDLALTLHKKHHFNVVLSRAPNDIGHVPALFFTEQTKIPWIANWNDPPAHLWPAPYERATSFFNKSIARRLTLNVFRKANLVTFPSERLRHHVVQSVGDSVNKKNTQIIPHIGLLDNKPRKRNADGCFRICHAGNLSRERNPKIFIEGIALFIERTKPAHPVEVRILGAADHELNSLAKLYRVSNYLSISSGLDYLATLAILEQSDVLAVIEASCAEGIFLPSKVADYVQIGRPLLLIAPLNGTLADLSRRAKIGEFATCGNAESVAAALNSLYKTWCDGRLNEEYKPEIIWHMFSPETIIQQYETIFSGLLT